MEQVLDLPESLRALYHAPIPLIILSNNRLIKMLNHSAESLFSINNVKCIGQRLERYLDSGSQAPFLRALTEASRASAATAPGLARQTSTRLQLQQHSDQSSSVWAEFSISAWFPTDEMGCTNTMSSPMSPKTEATSLPGLRAPHEALYTISIIPSSAADAQAPNVEGDKLDPSIIIKRIAFQEMDVAVVVISKDGKTQIANRACEEVVGYHLRDKNGDGAEPGVLSWAQNVLTVYDESFSRPFANEEWPVYISCFLGQNSPPAVMGVEFKDGTRKILHVSAQALRDQGGYGQHIGGVGIIRDITAERERQKQEEELKSDVHYRTVVDLMPAVNWQASNEGTFEWYSSSFHRYTGVKEEVSC